MSSTPTTAEPSDTTPRDRKNDPTRLRRVFWAAVAVAALAGGAASLIGVGMGWCLVPVSPSRGLAALESYGHLAVGITVVVLWWRALDATARRGSHGTTVATLIGAVTLAAFGYLLIQFVFAPLMTDSPDDNETRLNLFVTVLSLGLFWVVHRLPVVRPRAHWARWLWAAAFPVVMAAITYEWATRPGRGYLPDTCIPAHWASLVVDIAPVVLSLTTAAIAYSRIPPRGPSAEATA